MLQRLAYCILPSQEKESWTHVSIIIQAEEVESAKEMVNLGRSASFKSRRRGIHMSSIL